jgi:PIN domain nuclease of toxin-antitoxin system
VILLDTHVVVWLASDDPALGQKSCSLALTARAENRLAVSAVSFWEIALLAAVELKGLHADPADRFIAATAIVHRAILMTADARLLAWQSDVGRQNAGL